jgi:hypothetical protein
VSHSEKADAIDRVGCYITRGAQHEEKVRAHGHYSVVVERPSDTDRDLHNYYLLFAAPQAEDAGDLALAHQLQQAAADLRLANAANWAHEEFDNVVTHEGARYALDKVFEGTSYTAAWYLGLVAGTGYSALTADDTASQINGTNGWDEAGGSVDPTYSGNRKSVTWSVASLRSKASDSIAFTFTNSTAAYIKGAFLVTTATKDGTSGTLYSVGLSDNGDALVRIGDVANVVWIGSF